MKPFRVGAVLAIAAATAVGCAARVDRTVSGDDSASERVTQSTTFSLNKDEQLLEKGRQAASQGDYAAAESAYDAVYRNANAKPQRRAQALFLRGSVQSNLMNPKRDPGAALASYQAVVDEFPASEWRDDAEEAIASLRRTLEK